MTPLKYINHNNYCIICNGNKIHYDFSINPYRVEECSNCRMMRLNPQPTNEELAKIYMDKHFLTTLKDQNGHQHVSTLKTSTANYYLDMLESYLGGKINGHLLEIGCGFGDFLEQAAMRGVKVTGIEYSNHATDVARKKLGNKGDVICGDITDLLKSEKRYDYLFFADVLEHVRNPRDFMKAAHQLLTDNGIAIAIVPSTDSLSARLMKNKWMEFKPEHLWYFSRNTLTRLFYTEHFGQTKIHTAKKTLSFDYIAHHFDHYPTKPFTNIIQIIRRLTPTFLRKLPVHINAGGIMVIAKKKPQTVRKKLSVIMAAYNEENTIKNTIDKVLAKTITDVDIELIIVESNSTDSTQSILSQYQHHERVKIIWQDKARGKGHAIRAGLQHISGDFVLIQDADDEYDIEDYDALINPLVTGEAAFVLGARHGGSTWKMRKFSDQKLAGHVLNFGHWCFTLLINVFFGLKLKDPFTMYKVFRADCLEGISLECNRFDFDFELLIKLVKNGYTPIEIPVNYRSRSFKAGKKIRVFKDPLTWIKAIIKFRLQNQALHSQ